MQLQKNADLLYTLGTEGYFQGGFLSTDYTAATDLFFLVEMVLCGTVHPDRSHRQVKCIQWTAGFFAVPDVDGQENMETNDADSWWVWNCI